jgi:predicted transcriptional regulator
MSNKHPETSLEAYKMMTEPLLGDHHKKIIEALNILKKATAEEIAEFIGWDDKSRSARRMSELEREQIVYKPGEKKKTKYGRNAFVYSLITTPSKPKEYKQVEIIFE